MTTQDPRTRQLAERLAIVRKRISSCKERPERAGTTEPTLIVVTKFHPGADVLRLHELGVADVGENRDQEAAAKAQEVAGFAAAGLRWHFIGQLQKNKAKSVAAYAHSVHSIDRGSLVAALGRAMVRETALTGRAALDCFIQVDLTAAYPELASPGLGSPDAASTAAHSGRGGAAPSSVLGLADQIAASEALRLAGVMAVAPLGVAPEPAFALLANVSAELVAQHPGATGISAGMSHDLEAAMAAGATHLRVGSDILGARPAVL